MEQTMDLLEFLIDSARYGDTDDVKTALTQNAPVDGQDDSGRTGGRARQADLLLSQQKRTACY